MATYQEIIFNQERFHGVIVEEFDKAMVEAIDEVWASDSYYGQTIKNKSINGVEYEIVFNDIRAWVVYFGQGQDIDTSNPFLDEYMSSDFWANGRHSDGTVVKRGSSPYDQYNYSSGKLVHYDSGAEPAGQELIPPLQKGISKAPTKDFWENIEKTFDVFCERVGLFVERIEYRLVSECFEVRDKTI